MKHAPLKIATLALGTVFFAGAASATPLAPTAQKALGYEPVNGAVEPVHYRRYRQRHAYYPRYRYRYGYRPYYYSYGLGYPYYRPYYGYGYPYYGYGWRPGISFGFHFR
jgi:hypothetical protein